MQKNINERFFFEDSEQRVGGFSRVYRGVDINSRPPREVAIKILDGAAAEEPLLKTFFDREVESLLMLEHPNIVDLIDAGVDSEGKYFLVLEWVEHDLAGWIGDRGELPWEDFMVQMGLPLSEALAFAHERQVIHRDIKPSNVLIGQSGKPKLADFGISKIKSDLTRSPHTTIEFISRPYSPPEQDSTFSRDVFGLGVLIVGAISGKELRDYPDIKVALESLDVPLDLSNILNRAVSLSPGERPANGLMLLEELASVMRARIERRREQTRVHLILTPTVQKKWADLNAQPQSNAGNAIAKELSDGATLRPAQEPDYLGQVDGRQIYLGGHTHSYRGAVKAGEKDSPVVVLTGIQKRNSRDLERGLNLDLLLNGYVFTFDQPLNTSASRNALQKLVADLESHQSDRDRQQEERDQRRLLEQWRTQLAARQEVEKRRETPVRYAGYFKTGRRVIFNITQDPSAVEVGELRRVDTGTPGRQPIGEVENVTEDSIQVWFETDTDGLPQRGRLILDTSAASIKIERERSALLGLMHGGGEVVNHGLRNLILDPSIQEAPLPVKVEEWQLRDLDDDKRSVVQAALGCHGMFAVEGPPGTGKTTFIAELVAQELLRNPSAKILISSQTNVALDNALERVVDFTLSSKVIRLADRTGAKVSAGARPLLLDQQLEVWRQETQRLARKAFDDWCTSRGVDVADVEAAGLLSQIAERKEEALSLSAVVTDLGDQLRVAGQGWRADSNGPNEIDQVKEEFEERRDRQTKIIREMKELERRLKKLNRKNLLSNVMELSPSELRGLADNIFAPLGEDRNRVELYVLWSLRLARGEEFLDAILGNAQVIGGTCIGIARHKDLRSVQFDLCIVDEASKATATETLVPLVRARRWVLVGDQRQLPPFQEEALQDRTLIEEFELDEGELRTTLFDRMVSHLPAHSKASLRVQRRMTEAIGQLVSECFYEGQLVSRGPQPLENIMGFLVKPITWWSTSSLPKHHEMPGGIEGKSFTNPSEVRVVRDLLRRLTFSQQASRSSEKLNVLVIAPYSAQVGEIKKQIAGVAVDSESLTIEVSSIDAVQGREADLVIFSTVRSNDGSKVGFLDSDKRVNVALSRARKGLIIVGDSAFLSSAQSPFKNVISFIERKPNWASIEVLS